MAVKLAFGLNKTGDWALLFTEQDIKTCPVISNTSNIESIDKNIVDSRVPTRIKQSSDVDMVYKFNVVERLLKATYDKMAQILPKDQYLMMQERYLSIINSVGSNTETMMQDLAGHDLECIDCMSALLTQLRTDHEVQLVGYTNTAEEV